MRIKNINPFNTVLAHARGLNRPPDSVLAHHDGTYTACWDLKRESDSHAGRVPAAPAAYLIHRIGSPRIIVRLVGAGTHVRQKAFDTDDLQNAKDRLASWLEYVP